MNIRWCYLILFLTAPLIARKNNKIKHKDHKKDYKATTLAWGDQALLDKICSYRGRKTFLLSYVRSGNTWMRYCLEYLTSRPSFQRGNLKSKMNQPLAWSADFDIDCDKPPIEKAHSRGEIEKCIGNYDQDLLVVIVRNPKEALIRHKGNKITFNYLLEEGSGIDIGMPHVYFENLMAYESWNPKNRLLIYYEDLVASPRETLTQVLLFLNESVENIDYFMQKYDEHKKKSIAIYKRHQGKSETQGNDLLFHSKKMSTEKRKEIDGWIEQLYPEIWYTYLKDRYAEENNTYDEE